MVEMIDLITAAGSQGVLWIGTWKMLLLICCSFPKSVEAGVSHSVGRWVQHGQVSLFLMPDGLTNLGPPLAVPLDSCLCCWPPLFDRSATSVCRRQSVRCAPVVFA
jgi:hypothetical protein